MSGPGAAQAAKEKGNAAFKAGDFVAAIGHYTDAALADRLEPTYPLNRAAAYLKLGKHADAERDCSTCLALSPGNVKALFRRAQARLALRKLDEAEKDLNDALKREPANDAVKQELAKLKQIRVQAAAPKKPPVSVPPPPLAGTSSTSSSPTPASKKRRIPITIDREAGVKETPPSSSTSIPSASTTSDLLTPVSSRPLGKDEDASNSTKARLKSILSQSAPERGPQIVPATSASVSQPTAQPSARPLGKDKDASDSDMKAVSRRLKSLLEHRGPQIVPATSPPVSQPAAQPSARDPMRTQIEGGPHMPHAAFANASQARTTRVGGGIFRRNGSHELFKNSDGDTLATAPAPSSPTRGAEAQLPQPIEPGKAKATTLFALQREWTNRSTAASRWELLCTLPPSTLPALCKNLLEPAFLVAILEAFRELATEESVQPAMREYMSWLAKVSRFDTVVMFLSAREREIAQEVLRALGMKSWAGISV